MEWWERLNRELDQRRWSIPDLASKMGHPDDAALIEKLYKYKAGRVAQPRGTIMAEIAAAFDMSETELRIGGNNLTTPAVVSTNVRHPTHNAEIGGQVSGFLRIPLRGHSMGGEDGSLIFRGDENLGDILAPPELANVPGAYAVYVIGDSMAERYRHGEVAYVHPNMPVRKGDDCVIQIEANGERRGWIKQFVSMDSNWLKLQQINPRKTLRFPRKTVVSVHKIVFHGVG